MRGKINVNLTVDGEILPVLKYVSEGQEKHINLEKIHRDD